MRETLHNAIGAGRASVKGVDKAVAVKHTLTVLMAVVLIVGMGAPATANHSGLDLIEDFEDDLSDWTVNENDGTVKISDNTSANGSSSLMIDDVDGTVSSAHRSKSIDNPTNVTFWVKPTTNASDSSVNTDPDSETRLRNASGAIAIRIQADGLGTDSQWSINEGGSPTDLTAVVYDEWVKIEIRNINYTDASYDIWIGGTQQKTGAQFQDTSVESVQELRLSESIEAGRSYWDSIYVDLEDVDLRLEVPTHMWQNSTSDYSVWDDSGDSSKDVTDSATVTSSDPTNLTVHTSNSTLESTSNLQFNGEITITATYQGESVSKNVTVANLTRENTNLMQNAGDMTRSLWGCIDHPEGGTCPDLQLTMRILLIALGVGVAVASWATSWAGIGAAVVVVVMGWFMGWVGDGMVLITVFTGLFVALNVAANIDYSVRK